MTPQNVQRTSGANHKVENSQKTLFAPSNDFFFQQKSKPPFCTGSVILGHTAVLLRPKKDQNVTPHVNVSSSVGRLLYFGIPRLLRSSFFRMTDLHAANLRRSSLHSKNWGVDDENRRQLLNEFQVKRILLWWQEKRESLCSGRSRTGMGGLFPDTVLPFSPSSYHIPKTETQKIGPPEMADWTTV